MELSYWVSRWEKNNIGFHMPGGYPGLKKAWKKLRLDTDQRILVPLCGKSDDLLFLSAHSSLVRGVEISEKAILEFFTEQGIKPGARSSHGFTIYYSGNIELWCGDFFKMPSVLKGEHGYDLIYDKAAMVALPEEMRSRYAKKLLQLAGSRASLLLHHFVYDQSEMNGPPFSISPSEIENLFGHEYNITTLESNQMDLNNFKKFKKRGLKSSFCENLLLITPNNRRKT
jgi:thiopurine S-methyltransferase